MAATIKEVARQAGVSVATVSRVLNDSGPVKAATRVRILEIARELKYVPNGAARSLITSRTNTLGVLLPDVYGGFFSEVIRGLEEMARTQQYQVLLSSSHSDRDEMETAVRAMRGRVDGFVVMAPDAEAVSLRKFVPSSIPGVALNCSAVNGHYDTVNIDNQGGISAMVNYLFDQGHRRIAVVTGTQNNFDSRQRLEAYQGLMMEAACYDPQLEGRGDFSERSGFEAAKSLLELDSRPSAIFAFNDSMAIGALSALQEAGIRIPEDISVAGFDDIPLSRYLNPPLTTVHVPISELGARSMACLIEAVREGERHRRTKHLLETTLVVRRSTGAAAS